MILEALTQFDLKVSGKVQTLKPGDRLDLSDEYAEKLRRLAGSKVQVIEKNPCLRPGVWCEWFSPLFGHCTGQVVSMTVKGYIVTNHSVLGPHESIEIPVDWVCGVYREKTK